MYNRFLKTFLSYICANCTYKDKQVSPRFPDCDILLSRAFLRLKVVFFHMVPLLEPNWVGCGKPETRGQK